MLKISKKIAKKRPKNFLKKNILKTGKAYPGYAGQKFCVCLSISVYGIRRVLRIRISRIRIFWNTARDSHEYAQIANFIKNVANLP